MTALNKDRNTAKRAGAVHNDPVAASATIFAGSITVLNATGYAAPGTTAIGLTARGLCQKQVDNSAGADGDLAVDTQPGIYQLANDGSVTRTDIGGTAYIVDDQTVANTDGTNTRSAAGIITDVDADGVWVQIG
ncbi:MAG: hypothetical protein AB1Y26_07570 [Cycloclasticus sp.]